MKRCSAGCSKKPKPLTEFYAKPRGKDGLNARCKACIKKYRTQRRLANLELARELDRLRYSTLAYQNYQREYRKRRARLKQQQ